jgi:hypothetical protein
MGKFQQAIPAFPAEEAQGGKFLRGLIHFDPL